MPASLARVFHSDLEYCVHSAREPVAPPLPQPLFQESIIPLNDASILWVVRNMIFLIHSYVLGQLSYEGASKMGATVTLKNQ